MHAGRRLIAVAALSLLVLAGDGTAQAKQAPVLGPARASPLTLRGTGFRSGERVRLVLVRSGRTRVDIWVRAGTDGTFRARFPLLTATEPCRSLSVTATGARGNRALYTHHCRPADPAVP